MEYEKLSLEEAREIIYKIINNQCKIKKIGPDYGDAPYFAILADNYEIRFHINSKEELDHVDYVENMNNNKVIYFEEGIFDDKISKDLILDNLNEDEFNKLENILKNL